MGRATSSRVTTRDEAGRLRQPGRSSHVQSLDPGCRIGGGLREDAAGGHPDPVSGCDPVAFVYFLPPPPKTGVCGGGDGNGRKAGLPPERIL